MSRPHPAPSPPESVLDHVGPGTDVVVPIGNGEPVALVDALDAAGPALEGVRVHQMHALHDHPYLHGVHGDRLRHVSYFLSPVTRSCFHEGTVDLVPNHFSEVPHLLRHHTRDPLVLAAVSPPDSHGFFSLGLNADYVASLIGRARFFVEANPCVPRTFGRNQIHVSQVVGWCRAERPLVEVPPPPVSDKDRRIAGFVAERIPDGACLQAGIGGVPTAIMGLLSGHKDLGIHTELFSDGLMALVDAGTVTNLRKTVAPSTSVCTFALGTQALYDWLNDNAVVRFWPVDVVNDPTLIARQPGFVSVNATVEVDLLGQCASETVAGRYWSSSGGQADFAKGAMLSEGGQGFIVLHATTSDGTISRIRTTLHPGAPVTTTKNTVDCVVTEFGVAELRGRSVAERARALISVAHPDFRDELEQGARHLGYLSRP